MKKYLSLLTMAVLFCACEDWKTTSDDQTEPAWGKASLRIENPIVEGDSLCYHIEFNLDTLSGDGELASQLSAVLRDSVLYLRGFATVSQTMTSLADSLESEWKQQIAEQLAYDPEYKDMLQYTYHIEGSAVDNGNDSILSYQANTETYLGGAHGSYVVGYYNFNKNTGKLLSIRDIVPADKEKEVLKAMERQLCKDWDAANMTDLQEKTGITMLGDLYLTNNFLLKNDSIEFLFNQYEIAPYAAGLIDITVKRP